MIDDLINILIHIARAIIGAVSFLFEFGSNIFFEYIFWWLGWFPCRFYTLGKYPVEGLKQYEKAGNATAFIVISVGLGHVAFAIFVYAKVYP